MERNNEQVKNVWKPLCLVFAVLLALSWVFFGFLYSNGNVSFDLNAEDPSAAEQSDFIVGNIAESGIKLRATTSTQATAIDSVTLTATVEPANATNKSVSWSLAWTNASSEWATGKTVTDYVQLTPSGGDNTTATVSYSAPFGEQVTVTATSQDNPEAKASCTFDFALRVLDTVPTLIGSEGRENIDLDGFENGMYSDVDAYDYPVLEMSTQTGEGSHLYTFDFAYYGASRHNNYTVIDFDIETTVTVKLGNDLCEYLYEQGVYPYNTSSSEEIDVTDGIDVGNSGEYLLRAVCGEYYEEALPHIAMYCLYVQIMAREGVEPIFTLKVTTTGSHISSLSGEDEVRNYYGLNISHNDISVAVENLQLSDSSVTF